MFVQRRRFLYLRSSLAKPKIQSLYRGYSSLNEDDLKTFNKLFGKELKSGSRGDNPPKRSIFQAPTNLDDNEESYHPKDPQANYETKEMLDDDTTRKLWDKLNKLQKLSSNFLDKVPKIMEKLDPEFDGIPPEMMKTQRSFTDNSGFDGKTRSEGPPEFSYELLQEKLKDPRQPDPTSAANADSVFDEIPEDVPYPILLKAFPGDIPIFKKTKGSIPFMDARTYPDVMKSFDVMTPSEVEELRRESQETLTDFVIDQYQKQDRELLLDHSVFTFGHEKLEELRKMEIKARRISHERIPPSYDNNPVYSDQRILGIPIDHYLTNISGALGAYQASRSLGYFDPDKADRYTAMLYCFVDAYERCLRDVRKVSSVDVNRKRMEEEEKILSELSSEVGLDEGSEFLKFQPKKDMNYFRRQYEQYGNVNAELLKQHSFDSFKKELMEEDAKNSGKDDYHQLLVEMFGGKSKYSGESLAVLFKTLLSEFLENLVKHKVDIVNVEVLEKLKIFFTDNGKEDLGNLEELINRARTVNDIVKNPQEIETHFYGDEVAWYREEPLAYTETRYSKNVHKRYY